MASALAFLLSGCMGMCGKTLSSVDAEMQVGFPPTPENLAQAWTALEADGMEVVHGSGSFRAVAGSFSANVMPDSVPNATRLRFELRLPPLEADEDVMEAEEQRQTPQLMFLINATLASLDERLNWTEATSPKPRGQYYIC